MSWCFNRYTGLYPPISFTLSCSKTTRLKGHELVRNLCFVTTRLLGLLILKRNLLTLISIIFRRLIAIIITSSRWLINLPMLMPLSLTAHWFSNSRQGCLRPMPGRWISSKIKNYYPRLRVADLDSSLRSGPLKTAWQRKATPATALCDTLYPTHICTNNKRNN